MVGVIFSPSFAVHCGYFLFGVVRSSVAVKPYHLSSTCAIVNVCVQPLLCPGD